MQAPRASQQGGPGLSDDAANQLIELLLMELQGQ
jgi:hypothetical protein